MYYHQVKKIVKIIFYGKLNLGLNMRKFHLGKKWIICFGLMLAFVAMPTFAADPQPAGSMIDGATDTAPSSTMTDTKPPKKKPKPKPAPQSNQLQDIPDPIDLNSD